MSALNGIYLEKKGDKYEVLPTDSAKKSMALDAYVASLEKIGLSRYLELYAAALERFQSN